MTFTTILPPHPSHMLSILPTYGRLRFFVGLDMKTAQSPTCQSTVVISLFKDTSVLHKRLLWRLIKGVEEEGEGRGRRRGEGGGKEGEGKRETVSGPFTMRTEPPFLFFLIEWEKRAVWLNRVKPLNNHDWAHCATSTAIRPSFETVS